MCFPCLGVIPEQERKKQLELYVLRFSDNISCIGLGGTQRDRLGMGLGTFDNGSTLLRWAKKFLKKRKFTLAIFLPLC